MLSCLDDTSSGKKGRMTYLDTKSIIEKRLAHQKKGFLSDNEVAASVKEFQDLRSEDELNEIIVEEELRRFNKKMLDYNNSYVGNMSVDKEDGRVRFLFGQMNNMSSKPVRAVKVKGLKYLEKNMILMLLS